MALPCESDLHPPKKLKRGRSESEFPRKTGSAGKVAGRAAYRIAEEPKEAMSRQDLRTVLSALVTTDDRRGFRLPFARIKSVAKTGPSWSLKVTCV